MSAGEQGNHVLSERNVAQILLVYLTFVLHTGIGMQLFAAHLAAFDFLFFALISVAIPPLVGLILIASERNPALREALIGSASITVVAASSAFALVAVAQWVAGLTAPQWQPYLFWLLTLFSAAHLVTLIGLPRFIGPINRHAPGPFFALLGAGISLLLASSMNGIMPFFGSIYSLFSELRPSPPLLFAACAVCAGPAVLWAVIRLSRSDSHETHAPVWLLICLAAVPIFYLDLRFESDVLHFLTNASPANQMLKSGGVPLVDSYSQYGLGPLMMTWLAFLLTSPNLHAANLMAQVHSIVLYGCLLICIYRMTNHRRASLILGFSTISILLSGWWYGNFSLNSVPSSMGMRYLPCALVVLAISLLPTERRTSVALTGAMTLALLWSTEILIGSIAIVSLYICLEFSRSFKSKVLLNLVSWCLLAPAILASTLMCSATLLLRGTLPNITPLFEFLRVYNMTSDFWSIAATGQFFGWLAVAAIIGAALASAWYLALSSGFSRPVITAEGQGLTTLVAVRRAAPMAGLAIVMSSYYVGRSVDFTLIIAFMPCAGLFVPAFTSFVSKPRKHGSSETAVMWFLTGITAIFLSFAVLAVYRPSGPYRPMISEALRGNLLGAAERYAARPMLDAIASPSYEDKSGLAAQSLRAIEQYEPQSDQLTVLLGMHPTTPWSVHSDTVLLLAHAGPRFPISYVLSDELSSTRIDQILNFEASLRIGEAIFVRADQTQLGVLETALLAQLNRDYILQEQPFDGDLVRVFIVQSRRP